MCVGYANKTLQSKIIVKELFILSRRRIDPFIVRDGTGDLLFENLIDIFSDRLTCIVDNELAVISKLKKCPELKHRYRIVVHDDSDRYGK